MFCRPVAATSFVIARSALRCASVKGLNVVNHHRLFWRPAHGWLLCGSTAALVSHRSLAVAAWRELISIPQPPKPVISHARAHDLRLSLKVGDVLTFDGDPREWVVREARGGARPLHLLSSAVLIGVGPGECW